MNTGHSGVRIHESADVSPQSTIGDGTVVWHQAQIRENVCIGAGCILGKGVYLDFGVKIGDRVKVQNGCSIYHGARIESGVFLGPGTIITNDKVPRAINPDGSLKTESDWGIGKVLVRYGASVGAGSLLVPNVIVGRWSMIAAGSVVTRDVPDHALFAGVPARLRAFVCSCGNRLDHIEPQPDGDGRCEHCSQVIAVGDENWSLCETVGLRS